MKLRLFVTLLLLASAAWAHRYAYGAVNCKVDPDKAVVYVNGQATGVADDFDGWPGYLKLKPGAYDLEFRLDGYETGRVKVTVVAGEIVKVRLMLKQLPPSVYREEKQVEENLEKPAENQPQEWGRLRLHASPENAACYMDGAMLATAQDLARLHSPLQIASGRHIISCYSPGHAEATREFEMKPGEFLELDVVLVKK